MIGISNTYEYAIYIPIKLFTLNACFLFGSIKETDDINTNLHVIPIQRYSFYYYRFYVAGLMGSVYSLVT